ncbi:MAG: glycosyltransferase family 39 protein [Anaerolineae bacterium]|nr:glycosyltransferase family 39 protein [Anaerolineae bacterium]
MALEKNVRAHSTLLGLAALLLIGLALRVWQLERYGLWIDEIATAQCLQYDLGSVVECHRHNLSAPLFKVATNLVYTLAGRPPLPIPEAMLRLPEVLAGTLAILAAWLAAREWLGARGAWFNALLWTFAPTAIAYSQEARMYAWLLLSANLSAWLLFLCLTRRSWGVAVLYGFAAALNFYGHYLGLFVIGSQFLFAALYLGWAWRRGRQDAAPTAARILCAGGVAGVLMALWLPYALDSFTFLRNARALKTLVPLSTAYWVDVQSWIVLDAVDSLLPALLLLGVEVVGARWLWKNKPMTLALVGCWTVVVLSFVLIRQTGFSSMRYWVVLLVLVFWLVSAGWLALTERLTELVRQWSPALVPRVAPAAGAVLGILVLLPALDQFYSDQYESWRFDDWRGAAQFLRTHARPSEAVIAFGDTSIYHKLAFEFYLPSGANAPRVAEPQELDGSWAAGAKNSVGRAWGIVYARTPEMLERLRSAGGGQVDLYEFRNLALVSPRPLSPQETVAANTKRLIELYREFDAERFEFADALLSEAQEGENLVSNPEWALRKSGLPRRWAFGAVRGQVVVMDGEPALQLIREEGTDNVVAQQEIVLQSEQTYVFRFECRNGLTDGAQRIYILFRQPDGTLIVFPNGAGYVCPNQTGWHSSAFVFRAPPAAVAAPTATVLLSNAGRGDAYWRHLGLYRVANP